MVDWLHGIRAANSCCVSPVAISSEESILASICSYYYICILDIQYLCNKYLNYSCDMDDLTTFAKRAAWARYRKGRLEVIDLTQDMLAARVHCSQSHIGHVESGRVESSKFIVEIAHELEVDAYWLKTGKGNPEIASIVGSDQARAVAQAFDRLGKSDQDFIIESIKRCAPVELPTTQAIVSHENVQRRGQKQNYGSS